MGIKIVHCK